MCYLTISERMYTLNRDRELMATIQSKISRGHKYWYIVESRRVNGKPRPIVLEYLGKPDALLKRLQGLTEGLRLKSYSHGAIAALLDVAHKLDISSLINQYVKSPRSYMAEKPIRNNLTVGITLLLAAIGRVCMPTSKRGWSNWAKTTTLTYLLRCSLSKIDSQHFWDLMDALPIEAIPKIEKELLERIIKIYGLESDTLFFDTTNFFTYIDTTNLRCTIAQRGQNKQKRYDLRQVGLAMVVTREDMIPLFHLTYQGNMNDTKVFRTVIKEIKNRLKALNLDVEKHTLIFDRGNNSKKNMAIVRDLHLHYVGALTPYNHKQLIDEAIDNFEELDVGGNVIQVYRDKREIWQEERTVVVFISEKLKAGQIRGIYQSLEKKQKQLRELQESLSNPRAKKRNKEELENKITNLLKGQFLKNLIDWSVSEISEGKFQLELSINREKLNEIEDKLGFRIIMTDRHHWSTADIIKAYYGQSFIEHTFKNLKNPYHLALNPQFHWTDQKIIVHYFACVLGYQLSAIVWRQAKIGARFRGALDTLLDMLNNIRLGTILEESKTRGRVKATYKLEEMSDEEDAIMEALAIKDFHNNRPKFKGVGVYTSDPGNQ
ncbi:MAG: IS1634 family transposase [Candidatus Aminicenantes bacterium]|nr:MAG: IS1634 family transposase [Candidatus Aminicenantes bacterium]